MKTKEERAMLHNSARPIGRNLQSSKAMNGQRFDNKSISGITQSTTIEGQEYFVPMETEKPEITVNNLNKKVNDIINEVKRVQSNAESTV